MSKSILIQFGCTFIYFWVMSGAGRLPDVSIMSAMTSFSAVWPSYAIRALTSDQSPLGYKITQNEGNFISSIPMLGSLISTLGAGYVAEAFGRRKSQIFCGLLYTVAWSLIVTARSTIQILIGRFLTGLSSGAAVVLLIVHISEITQLSIRGSTTTTASLLYNLGIMASYLQGWFFSYDVICYVSLTASVVYVIFLSYLKETPPYLIKIGKEKEALSSLKFYRGATETTGVILEELAYLRSLSINDDKEDADVEKPTAQSEKEKLQNQEINLNEYTENKNPWVLLFKVPHNRRAIITYVTFVVLSVSMGMVAVQTYASQFFAKAAPEMSSDLSSVLFSLVLVISSGLTMVVTDLVPRRTLMISTCVIATVCLATLGVVLRYPEAPSWIALLAILIYCVTFHLGVINLVFVQLSESFGPEVNSAATAMVLGFMFAANFIVLTLFVPGVEYIGIDGTFLVFAVIGAITTVLSIFWIKETRRMPLHDVQKMYANGFLYKRISDTEN